MTHADYAFTSLALWREARGEGEDGMTAVACVIRNRVNKHGSTPMAQVVKPWAFSSITAKGDPELTLYPLDGDPQWLQAQQTAQQVLDGQTNDTTGGATLYIAPAGMAPGTTVPYTLPDGTKTVFPKSWNQAAVTYSCTIGKQIFFVEK